jgi:hypothetical protein
MWGCGVTNLAGGVLNAVTGQWWVAFTMSVFGVLFLAWPWSVRRWRQTGYVQGYWAGRDAMWASMSEASVRGMTFQQWQLAEMEREANMLAGGGPR